MESVYKKVLLDHFHNPRNKGGLDAMDVVRRGSNPRCGDDIEVGVSQNNQGLTSVRFRGRGCSICLASASMMSECTTDLSYGQTQLLVEQILLWFSESNGESPANTTLASLGAVRQHSARQKCVLLPWQALQEALIDINGKPDSRLAHSAK